MNFMCLHSLQTTHTAAQTWVLPLMSPLGDKIFLEEFEMNKSISLLAATAASSLAYGDVIEIDIAGVNSNDGAGSEINEVLSYDLGDIIITGIGWDNVVGDGSPTGVSWGNEMSMLLNGAVQVSFFPSEGSATGGGVWGPASSDGILALSGGLPLDGAALTLEFFEGYDDASGATDAFYQSGTIFVEYTVVPAPGALALLGLAGLGRRRRS